MSLTSGNLAQLLVEQVLHSLDQFAILQEERRVTYSQLDFCSRQVAHQLSSQSLPCEGVVGILTSLGIEHIIAQVGILYAGGTVLPLDPNLSNEEIQMRLRVVNAEYLVSDSHNAGRCSLQHTVILAEGEALLESLGRGLDEVPSLAKFPIQLAQDHRSHMFFTSGTTGVPKAVQVLSRGIARLHNLWAPVARQQIVGHINHVGFDVSLVDIWIALINGCTISVLDRELLLNPDRFAYTLEEKSITAMFIPASVFSIVARANPQAFHSFDVLLVGGESPSLPAVETVLRNGPPKYLINAYGPTECSVLATTHNITLDDVIRRRLPLGQPLNHTTVCILDDSLQVMDGEGSGELALGGLGLSRGYLNDVAKTNQAFISIPDNHYPGSSMIVYRTGDLVQRHENGDIVWRGRLNNEVKLRGYRVNLDAIEDTLTATNLLVAAAVVKVPSPDGLSASLVAGIVFKDRSMTDSQLLLQKARQSLPHYMVPSQVINLESLPLNRNGKIDRKELEKVLQTNIGSCNPQMNIGEMTSFGELNSTESIIRVLWEHILGVVTPRNIGPDTDFLALGATSLSVASLTILAREKFGITLSARAVYENSTLKQLTGHIDKVLQGEFMYSMDQSKQQWKLDTELAQNLILPDGRCTDWTSQNEGKVLLTGATGFVAAFLLRELVLLPTVQSIKCLVRAKSPGQGLQRILDNLAKYGIQDLTDVQLSKIVAVVGDLADPTLGLGRDSFQELGNWASIIFHLGAQVNYNQPYTVHRPANVLGTLHILQLITIGRPKPLHYISSIAALGPTGLLNKKQILEDEALDAYVDSIAYDNGYGQSQWVAEKMIHSLIRKGFPIATHRLGFVLCHSKTGIGNRDDFMSRLVVDCVKLGAYPELPDQRKELLPVDYVASAILAISLSNKNLGRVFNITPINESTSSMDMQDLFQAIIDLTGIPLSGLPYDEWLLRLQDFGKATDLRMAPLMPMLTEKVYQNQSRWEVYQFMAKFCTDNTQEALRAAGLSGTFCQSTVDRSNLARYLSFLQVK